VAAASIRVTLIHVHAENDAARASHPTSAAYLQAPKIPVRTPTTIPMMRTTRALSRALAERYRDMIQS
jgi:hypothetical protein